MPVTYDYARPLGSLDVLLFTVPDFWGEERPVAPRLEIALIRRERDPYEGTLALPGTVLRIEPDETGAVDATDLDAARRVLRDKAGVEAPHLEQLFTWFTRDVDPRGPTIAIAYFAVVPFGHFRDAGAVIFMPADELPELAFRHRDVVARGVERVRGKAAYSNLPGLLIPELFTFKELQLAYEAVLNRKFDQTNFGRRVLELGIVAPVDGRSPEAREARARAMRGQTGRPPQVFRLKDKGLTTLAKSFF